MRRLVLLLGLIGAVAASGLSAPAGEFRFPKTGKHAFRVDLPKGWQTKLDALGGLLLVPPASSQHALIYIAIGVDDKWRGQPDSAVAAAAAKTAGIALSDKQDPVRISDAKGAALYRGMAFYGTMPAKRGLARKVKIAIFRLEPNSWAQVLVVTQPGINATELDALNQVLNGLALAAE